MFPSLGLLTGVLTGLVAKLGIAGLDKYGYMPQSTYVNRALKALEEDDLDEAIRNFRLATVGKRSTNKTEIAHEIISQAIMLRIAKLQDRVDEIEEILQPRVLSVQYWRNFLPRHRSLLEELGKEQAGFREAIEVLERIKEQLTEGA
ncbi:MAG TPA: hypothetical protein VJZ70_00125 [Limnochordia bacterium]|nr:hypothetical protein [Limnochordia bacterium]